MKRFFTHIGKLWQDNPLFSIIMVLAAALTITFCMVLYMVYAFRTKDIAPESHRSRTLYSSEGYSYWIEDFTDRNRGMSEKTARAIFDDLEGVEEVSYYINARAVGTMSLVGTSPSNAVAEVVKYVDDGYFRIYDYDFVAGAPFSREQAKAGRSEVIITDRLAGKYFGSPEGALGKTLVISFEETRVVGVVREVSSFFSNAYSGAWVTYPPHDFDWWDRAKDLRGNTLVALTVQEGTSIEEMKQRIERKVEQYSDTLEGWAFELEMKTEAERSFGSGGEVGSPKRLFALLIIILLLVPAINMGGLLSSQLSKRMTEVGVRKAYGATTAQLAGQLLTENLVLTLVGGVVGLGLSFGAVALFKNVLLMDTVSSMAGESFGLPLSLFFDWRLFLVAFVYCLFINLLSAALPIWRASQKPITQMLKG